MSTRGITRRRAPAPASTLAMAPANPSTGKNLRPRRRIFCGQCVPPPVSKLLEAIEAEVRGDFKTAAAAYETLTDVGSTLDRIGIYQALARCREKAGELRDAAPWRREGGQGKMGVSG